MSIQPLWLTHFIEILLVLELQLTKFIFGMFSYKAHFRPQISSNEENERILKAREELNQILKEKFQTKGRSKISVSEEVSHQRRSKKVKLMKTESISSSEGFGEHKGTTLLVTVVRLSCMTERRSTDHMKRFQGSLKR